MNNCGERPCLLSQISHVKWPTIDSVVPIVETIVFTHDHAVSLMAESFEEESRLFGGQNALNG